MNASDVGAGDVLQQEDDQDIDHSNQLFFKEIWEHPNEIFYDSKGNSSFTVGPQAL